MTIFGGRGNAILAPLRARLSGVHANHKKIAAGAALIGVLIIVAKIFVAGREIAIAWRFGVSGIVDSYQLAVTITMWLPMLLTSVMTVVLVPRLVALRLRPTDRDAFVSELNGSILIVSLVIAALTWIFAPQAATLLGSRAALRTFPLTTSLARDIAPVALFLFLSGYLSARLQARERFAYSISEAIPAAGIALFVLVPIALSAQTRLVWGAVGGYALQLVVLALMTRRVGPGLGGLRFRHRSGEWRPIYGALLVMGLAQILIGASIPIDQAFAARLGEGAVATLGYANRLLNLATTLGSVMVSRALLPVLSSSIANGEMALGERQALQWSLLLFAIASVGAVIGWFVVPDVVRLLFQRGAFDTLASVEVTRVLRFGLFQLPPYFAGVALVQWYSAIGRFKAFLFITSAALLLKVILNLLLTPILGLGGIMLATSAMYGLTALSVWGGMKRQTRVSGLVSDTGPKNAEGSQASPDPK